jgi:enterochelin esterase family protein
MKFPRDAYIEYAFVRGDKRVSDALNPRTTPNGLGDINRFFYMPDAAPTPLVRRQRGVPRGEVTRHTVNGAWLTASKKRTVYLYQPHAPEPCPLVVVLDGVDYLRRARLPNIVDNLIAQKRIRPIALALVESADQARGVEYACNDLTVAFLVEHVLPLADAHLNLIDVGRHSGAYGVLGASMGGLMAAFAGLRAPHVFGRILSQSGAFSIGEVDLVVTDLVRDGKVRPIKIWMDVGSFEWLLVTNRRMHALLVNKGYDVTYREYNGGHNYPAWRDDVWRGLEHLFGGRG